MKSRITLLAAAAALTAGIAVNQAAYAGEAGSSRFTFAPNVWKVEGVRIPALPETPHAVKSGAVPQGAGFLGLSPQLLTKPAPPPPAAPKVQTQTQVAARPSFTRATPQLAAPKYNSAFGTPGELSPPPVVANNPGVSPSVPQATAQPGTLQPQANAAPARAANPARPLVAHHHGSSSQSVHGVLTHKQPSGLIADAGKKIDSYGGGYVPGPFLPAAYNGDGSSTQADVHGRVLTKRK